MTCPKCSCCCACTPKKNKRYMVILLVAPGIPNKLPILCSGEGNSLQPFESEKKKDAEAYIERMQKTFTTAVYGIAKVTW